MKMMAGTEKKPDYLVLMTKGGASVGVKPIMNVVGSIGEFGGVFVGARIRAAWDVPDGKVVDVAPDQEGKVLIELFPGIDWQKYDDKRLSSMHGFAIERAPYQAEEIRELISEMDVSGKLVNFVLESLDGEAATDKDAAVEWLAAKFQEGCDELSNKVFKKSTAHHDPEEDVASVDDVFKKLLAPSAAQKGKSAGLKIVSSKLEGQD